MDAEQQMRDELRRLHDVQDWYGFRDLRLVFSDWLEEHGKLTEAQLTRLEWTLREKEEISSTGGWILTESSVYRKGQVVYNSELLLFYTESQLRMYLHSQVTARSWMLPNLDGLIGFNSAGRVIVTNDELLKMILPPSS